MRCCVRELPFVGGCGNRFLVVNNVVIPGESQERPKVSPPTAAVPVEDGFDPRNFPVPSRSIDPRFLHSSILGPAPPPVRHGRLVPCATGFFMANPFGGVDG